MNNAGCDLTSDQKPCRRLGFYSVIHGLFNTGGLEVQGGHDQNKSLKDYSGCCSGNNVGNKRGSKEMTVTAEMLEA